MGFEDVIKDCDTEFLEQYCFEKLNCKHVMPDNLKAFNNLPFSLVHLNMQSLNKHYDDLLAQLASMDHTINIIGCTENWMNDSTYKDILNLNVYTLYNNNRTGKLGGVVCIYTNKKQSVTVRDDLYIDNDQIDSIFVEINIEGRKSIVVGVIYRPPHCDLNDFFDQAGENIKLHELHKQKLLYFRRF